MHVQPHWKMRGEKINEFILILSGVGRTNYFCEFMVEDLWCCKYARQPDFRAPNSISLANSRVSKKKTHLSSNYPVKKPLFTSELYR